MVVCWVVSGCCLRQDFIKKKIVRQSKSCSYFSFLSPLDLQCLIILVGFGANIQTAVQGIEESIIREAEKPRLRKKFEVNFFQRDLLQFLLPMPLPPKERKRWRILIKKDFFILVLFFQDYFTYLPLHFGILNKLNSYKTLLGL